MSHLPSRHPALWPALTGVVSIAALLIGSAIVGAAEKPDQPWLKPDPAAVQHWRDLRFGMFIHWGPVSIKGTEIGWSRGAPIPIEEYDNLYKQFNPTKFNADEWVGIAKAAGMKYMVLTTKHHDGFCLWDTKQTDYNVMNSPFHRDVLKELSEACKKQGIALGTYYSVCDWRHPDFALTSPGGKTKREKSDMDAYQRYLLAQTKELVIGYGPLLTLWNDVPQAYSGRGFETIRMVRGLQPDILVNNRTGNGGDYDTPEQTIGGFNMKRPWETCMTICNQWAWKPNDKMKSLEQCLHVLVRTAGGDGNLLFNVGPMPTGEIEPRQVERLKEMGQWLQKYGQTIYGARGGPYQPGKTVVSTRQGTMVYLHLLGNKEELVTLPKLPAGIVNSKVLTGGQATVAQTEQGMVIRLPVADRDPIDTIIALELDKPALEIEPIRLPDSESVPKKIKGVTP